jgi:hypothetical protein
MKPFSRGETAMVLEQAGYDAAAITLSMERR